MSLNDYEFTAVHTQLMQVRNRDWYNVYGKLEEERRMRRRMMMKRIAGGAARLFRRIASLAFPSETETGTSDRAEKIGSGTR